jgi:hypothetical protein
MSNATPLANADQRLQAVYAYWQRKRGARAMPSRADIEPMEMAPLLQHLMLVDVEEGPRFRYRLFGTAVVAAFGMDPTGQYVDAVMQGAYKEFLLGLYRDVVALRRPVYSTSVYGTQRDAAMWTERLMLPLSTNGETVDKVLAVQVFSHGSPLKALTVRIAQEKAEPIANIANPLG